jgi:uncharacterized protein (DUF2062 family)
MPKQFFQRYLPHPGKIREIKSLEFLGDKLHRPNLWHLNRRSVSLAFACGLWAMYTPPLPWQMAIAAVLAIYFNANLPISVALVWITNPFTWVPLYYLAYEVGALAMGRGTFSFGEFSELFSIEKVWELGAPLLLGCFILMNVGAVLGYFGTQLLWRRAVLHRLMLRKYRNAPVDLGVIAQLSHAEYMQLLKHRELHRQENHAVSE